MNEKLQEELYKKYPKIFVQRNLPENESCMYYGLCVGDGWYNIINNLCESIQSRIDNPPREEIKCTYNKIASFWNRNVALRIHNLLFKPMNWTAKFIAGENNKKMPTSWSMDEYNKWRSSRPNISNRLEHYANHIAEYLSFTLIYQDVKIPQVEAEQVKEKISGLRFYYTGGDDVIVGMVRMAQRMSYYTCELCGSPGEVCIKSGWYKTICETCRRKKGYKGYKPAKK